METEATDPLARAFASTRPILAQVTPDQLDQPTPCSSWDVRALVNHVVGGTHWFAATMRDGVAPELPAADHASGDIVRSFDEGAAACLAEFGAPGALEKTVKLPFGEFPGAMFIGLATTDTFVHGWDLARALGQKVEFDPEMAHQLLAQAQGAIPDGFRGPDGQAPFGPIVDIRDSAPAADRLAAFLGRTP